ncbi:MAG: hypothetical protein R3C11_11960 [Planctomycetaceae bacterium]
MIEILRNDLKMYSLYRDHKGDYYLRSLCGGVAMYEVCLPLNDEETDYFQREGEWFLDRLAIQVCKYREKYKGRLLNVLMLEESKHIETRLSASLKPIYELELSLGNLVARVDEPAGSKCPYSVVFAKPLHRSDIQKLDLPESVQYWECHDPHYEINGGYQCELSQHCVEGPLPERRS